MAYSWYKDIFLPAEYKGLVRELQYQIAKGENSAQQAKQQIAEWKNFVAEIDKEANAIDWQEEWKKQMELRGSKNGNSTD